MTPVIFRKYKDTSEVIAIFPTLLGDMSVTNCSNYVRIGQHGACNPQSVMDQTVSANFGEYKDLLAELEGIGYDDLKVYKRLQAKWVKDRWDQLTELKNRS